ncbi:MAG: hypothetical protein J6W94_01685 [Bacteroidales bacterium]|nr:hypothetical protein [Bacteroidales bacterium]MBP5675706.1 hypothetical protein [Bacteroidales bacterium]
MACFIAPLVQAIATTAYRRHSKKPVSNTLGTLEKMLWGGTLMLITDHIINGELTWRFPFITALGNTGGWEVVLREILTVGVPICAVITLLWGIWALVARKKQSAQL